MLVLGLKWHCGGVNGKLDGKCLRELFGGEKHSLGANLEVAKAVWDCYADINLKIDAKVAYALSDAPLFKDLDSVDVLDFFFSYPLCPPRGTWVQ